MEVTLYFDGVEKKLPLKRNTIGLRLEWQLLMSNQAKQSEELEKKQLSWKFRAEQNTKKLSTLPINDANKDEIERLKTIDYELVKEQQDFAYTLVFVASEQIVNMIKLITDTTELSKEERLLFDSNLAGSKFWEEQDLTQMSEVIKFFRG